MKRVSIREALTMAIDDSVPGIARHQNLMLKWAKKAERGIGSALGYKVKSKTINVTGSYLDLPEDCHSIIGVYPGDYEDQANIQYDALGYVRVEEDTIEGADVYDRDLTRYWVPVEVSWFYEHHYEEIGNQLHLIGDFTAEDFTLVYRYNETNINGDWIINESHIEALSLFIQYKYAQKFRWKFFLGDKLLRAGHNSFINELDFKYNQSIRGARAEDGAENKTTL